MLLEKGSVHKFPNPGQELRKIRNQLALEKEILEKVDKEELVILDLATLADVPCTCESYTLKPSKEWAAGSASITPRLASQEKIAHSPVCNAVLEYKAKKCKSAGSSSSCSLNSLCNSLSSVESDEYYGDLSEFFDPLKANRGCFEVFKVDLAIVKATGEKNQYSSLAEFLRPAGLAGTAGSVVNLCVNPNGTTICVEKTVVERFHKLVWDFVNYPNIDTLLSRIREHKITPYKLVQMFGRQTSFKPELKTVTWAQFERVFPDWSYPSFDTGSLTSSTATWYYATHPNYGHGRVYPRMNPLALVQKLET